MNWSNLARLVPIGCMNLAHYITPFSFFPEQSSSFFYQHVFAVYLSLPTHQDAGRRGFREEARPSVN